MKHPKGMRGWRELVGDVNWADYGGSWARKARDGAWYIIAFTNMWDACGEDDCKSSGQAQYLAEVYQMNLAGIAPSAIKSALGSCGYKVATDGDKVSIVSEYDGDVVAEGDTVEIVLVECLRSYGLGAPLDSCSGDVRPAHVRAEARRAAEGYMHDAEKLETALDRPVNKIGSTAREYGRGDTDSALLRGNDPEKQLMRKIHGLPEQLPAGRVVMMRYADLQKCPFVIIMPDHYRADGTCKCDDAEHRKMMIKEWGYKAKQFAKIPLRPTGWRAVLASLAA